MLCKSVLIYRLVFFNNKEHMQRRHWRARRNTKDCRDHMISVLSLKNVIIITKHSFHKELCNIICIYNFSTSDQSLNLSFYKLLYFPKNAPKKHLFSIENISTKLFVSMVFICLSSTFPQDFIFNEVKMNNGLII